MSDGPDLAEFFKYSRPKKPPCRIGYVLSQLKPKERSELQGALDVDSGLITNSAIVTWAKARGHDVTNNYVTSHRSGRCTCAHD